MAKLKINYPVFRHAPAVTSGRGSLRSVVETSGVDLTFMLSGDAAVKDYVKDVLGRSGFSLTAENCIEKPPGEPTVATVRDAARFLSGQRGRRLIAVGGGSVMDWARLSWAEDQGVIQLSSGEFSHGSAARLRPEFWLAPTTCGTGAEAAGVVVYAGDDGAKISVVSPVLAASQVLLDSRFLDTIAPRQLAAFVCDALSHALESFLSIVPNSLAKESALSAFGLMVTNFSTDPGSAQKDRMMEASFLAGVAAANCSVGIVHSFAHSIGADGLPHGLANACALEAGIEFNSRTPQMNDLLDRLGLDSVGSLIGQIRPITDCALQNIDRHPAVNRLGEPEYRSDIAERMSRDITIRSNPRRPTPDERLAFVADVVARISLQ